MFESDERKNSRSETMKGRKTIVTIVILAVISSVGWAFVPTAGAASAGIGGIPEVLNRLDLLLRQISGLELACTTPDLVPLPVGSAGFSRCDDKGNLHVTIQNQGGGNAAASVTQVFFRVAGSTQCGTDCAQVDAATSPLAAFSGIDLAIKIPNGCFDTNNICKFKISVDGNNDVKNESNEANNNAAGECSGTIL